MKRIKYVSRFSPGLTSAALDALTDDAARRNAEIDVTGVLFSSGGLFVQVLEGPEDALDALFQRISGDPRHRNVLLLDSEESIEERLFPHWSMRRLSPAEAAQERMEPLQALLATVVEQERRVLVLKRVLERALSREIIDALADSGDA